MVIWVLLYFFINKTKINKNYRIIAVLILERYDWLDLPQLLAVVWFQSTTIRSTLTYSTQGIYPLVLMSEYPSQGSALRC